MAVDQLVNCPRGVRPRARRHSVSVCQVIMQDGHDNDEESLNDCDDK